MALDAAGNLYIADGGDGEVRKVNASTGLITTVAGSGRLGSGYSGDGGPATSAQLTVAYGVTVDAAGNLYIADSWNQRIRKVTASTGVITTVAGNGKAGYSGDGGPATSAQLNSPSGVAVDSAGNVYIADTANNAIRRLTPAAIPLPTIRRRREWREFHWWASPAIHRSPFRDEPFKRERQRYRGPFANIAFRRDRCH